MRKLDQLNTHDFLSYLDGMPTVLAASLAMAAVKLTLLTIPGWFCSLAPVTLWQVSHPAQSGLAF